MEIEIFWVTQDGTFKYKKEFSNEIWNFLFWEGDEQKPSLLIAGNGLYTPDASHTSLRSQFLLEGGSVPDHGIPDGAGNRPGRLGTGITRWTSERFGVNTPARLRGIISEALGLNFFS